MAKQKVENANGKKSESASVVEKYISYDSVLQHLYCANHYIVEQIIESNWRQPLAVQLARLYVNLNTFFSQKASIKRLKKLFYEISELSEPNIQYCIDKYWQMEFSKIISDLRNMREKDIKKRRQKQRQDHEYYHLKRSYDDNGRCNSELYSDAEISDLKERFNTFNSAVTEYEKKFAEPFHGCGNLSVAQIDLNKIQEMITNLTNIAQEMNYHINAHVYEDMGGKGGDRLKQKVAFFDFELFSKKHGIAIGYIYIMTNDNIPGLIKVGETNNLYRRRQELSSPTGVPGKYQIVYYRQTFINYQLPGELKVETKIKKELKRRLIADGHWNDRNLDLSKEEFYIVPSILYAMNCVEEEIDKFEIQFACWGKFFSNILDAS